LSSVTRSGTTRTSTLYLHDALPISAIGISIQMAILMMALGVGAQLAGIELTGADMIKLLIGHGDVGGEMHPLFAHGADTPGGGPDRKSTRLNSSHVKISYAVCCLKK